MESLERQLIKRKQLLKKTIQEKKAALKKAPEGRLRFYEVGNSVKYYHCLGPSDYNGKYIKKAEVNLAKALAQKDYDEKVLKKAEDELKIVEKLIRQYQSGEIEKVYFDLREPRQRLIAPVKLPDQKYIELWKAKDYKKKPILDESGEFITENGERVRSKSELIIADTLFRAGIPYQYEVPIKLNGVGIIHPDFRVLNVRKRKTYFWEHLGKMDDSRYAENAIKRICNYEKNGYFPGESLLLTYETQGEPLGTRQIKMIIEQYLI